MSSEARATATLRSFPGTAILMPTANKAARTLRDDEVDIRDFLRCERLLADYCVDLGYELPVIARKGPFWSGSVIGFFAYSRFVRIRHWLRSIG